MNTAITRGLIQTALPSLLTSVLLCGPALGQDPEDATAPAHEPAAVSDQAVAPAAGAGAGAGGAAAAAAAADDASAVGDDAAANSPISTAELEARYWTIEALTPPPGVVLELGGMDWFPDGRLVLCTRRGQVWIVEHALAEDPSDARFSLYAEGLHEPLGLNVLEVADGHGRTRHALYVLQRGELSELRDEDGDGRAETWLTVCDDWGLSGNYHEFAFGLPDDGQGKLYLSLNVGFLSPEWWLGVSLAPWRGWVLRVDPLTGEAEPLAHGFRSPAGLGFDGAGRLLVTDNQGDWMPAGPVFAVQPGGFHGHPASLSWTDAYREQRLQASSMQPPEQPRVEPALWLPYGWSRSAGDLARLPGDYRFGPYSGDQLVLAELTNGQLLRIQLEQVQGVTQGAVFPLLQQLGSAFRVSVAPDGSIFAGLTNRGWGGLAPDHGLLRVRPTGARPFEIDRVTLSDVGFDLFFSGALAHDLTPGPDDVTLVQYDYDYWWEYGSPERHTTTVPVTRLLVSDDRRALRLQAPELRAGMAARVTLTGLRDARGEPLLHDSFSYTVNRLPGQPAPAEPVAKLAPVPPPKQSGREGWLRLTYGDALDAWDGPGWQLVNADIGAADRSGFDIAPGNNALVNVGQGPAGHLSSRWDLTDGSYHVEFMLAEGSRSVVWIAGRYAIELTDDTHGLPEWSLGTGTIMGGAASGTRDARPALPPTVAGYRGAGQWHALDVKYEAPVRAADGTALSPAILREVRLDDVLIHADVELWQPSGLSAGRPSARSPLVIAGDTGPVALRTLEHKPARTGEAPADAADGWLNLLAGDDLSGWTLFPPRDADQAATQATGAGSRTGAGVDPSADTREDAEDAEDEPEPTWSLEDGELLGAGQPRWLLSPSDGYRDLSLRATVRINEGGDSGIMLRARPDGRRLRGYEAQINASFADEHKTGSLYGLVPVKVQLIPPGTWCDLELDVVDEPEGTHITIGVNGVTVVDHIDPNRRHKAGHIALQQHHEGGYVRMRDLRVKVR